MFTKIQLLLIRAFFSEDASHSLRIPHKQTHTLVLKVAFCMFNLDVCFSEYDVLNVQNINKAEAYTDYVNNVFKVLWTPN